MSKELSTVVFLVDDMSYPMEIHDASGNRWVPSVQVGEAIGTTRIRALVSELTERGEMVEGKHWCTLTVHRQSDGKLAPHLVLSYRGIIRISMRSDGTRAPSFRDWAEDVLYEVMTKGEYVASTARTRKPSVSNQYSESRRIMHEVMLAARLLGTEEAMARAIAVQEARKAGGIDFTPLLAGNTIEIVPVTATELGKLAGMTARQVNEALFAAGLQIREDKQWKPTEKAKDLCTVNPYKSEHSQHTGYRILWKPEVAKRLKSNGKEKECNNVN